ncbi:MAG TPA: hydroxymethylbilane synthase, partial [Flavihumibacter sp.]|nr:hydroxymethylbilane synthase [Flavihumibacter sp.]
MKQTPVNIGTRDSELALWQARLVQEGLQSQGIDAVLVPLKSEGDIDLITPL